MPEIVTPQIRFLAACCYLPASAEGLVQQRHLLEQACAIPIPAQVLWEGIQRHRIFALAERVLRTHSFTAALGQFAPALAARARQGQLDSLTLFGESLQLSALFSKHGIEHRFLKGPILSQKIYGNPGLRRSKDLDLQVRPQDIAAAVRVLQAAHWEPTGSAERWEQSHLYRWIAERRLRHFEFVHRQTQSSVELHWRMEPAHAPKLDELWWAHWPAAGSPLSAAEALHLCLHGASHAWNRLKWIGDLQAIFDRNPALWTETRALSKELDLELIVAQAILLLQILFQAEPDACARAILASQPCAPQLAKFALHSMQLKSARLYESPAGIMAYAGYLLKANQRLPWRARLGNLLGRCLIDDLDLGKWNGHWATLPAIPFIRASQLLSRSRSKRSPEP